MSAPAAHLSPEAKASLPRHVAIIMDGNGRWAKQRHLPRIEGHRAGAESARVIIRTAGELGIKYLTLYAFSVENWNRPKDEVDALMKYLVHYLKTETPELNKNNVRLEVIGQIYRLPEIVQEHLRKSIATLSKNNGLTLIMALSYGGRTEIVDAVRSIAAEGQGRRTRPARHHGAGFRPAPLHAQRAGPGRADPDQRRDAREQFPALADFLHGTGGDARPSGRTSASRSSTRRWRNTTAGTGGLAQFDPALGVQSSPSLRVISSVLGS